MRQSDWAHIPTRDALCTLLQWTIFPPEQQGILKGRCVLAAWVRQASDLSREVECWRSVTRQAGVISLHSTVPSMSMQISLI